MAWIRWVLPKPTPPYKNSGLYFVPGFDPVLAARLAPLVLVALGGEVLYDTAKPARVRLNGFSVALCLFLMGAVFCASFIPLAADWVMHNGGHAIGWYF